ncbi:DeoR/GlpR family DNA-binding transcription regulator [Paenibacillus sp. P26]|nr:DeoR/GlpR family DNA-binding transcription regulator [Paenibacillus sp. P26]
MFEEERKAKIMERLSIHSRVDVQELIRVLGVSESTVRRDLKELEEAKPLKRTHGGAVSLSSVNFEPSFTEKEIRFQEEKKAIAKKAAEFIRDGDTILLDSGTTTQCLVRELKAFNRLTVVTNSVNFAYELQNHSGIELMLLGGTLRKGVLSLVGPFTDHCLGMIHVDKAFVAANGISVKQGLTTPNFDEAQVKRHMIGSAKTVFLLADHSKVDEVSFASFGRLQDIHVFITDDKAPESFISAAENLGLEVHTAGTDD